MFDKDALLQEAIYTVAHHVPILKFAASKSVAIEKIHVIFIGVCPFNVYQYVYAYKPIHVKHGRRKIIRFTGAAINNLMFINIINFTN